MVAPAAPRRPLDRSRRGVPPPEGTTPLLTTCSPGTRIHRLECDAPKAPERSGPSRRARWMCYADGPPWTPPGLLHPTTLHTNSPDPPRRNRASRAESSSPSRKATRPGNPCQAVCQPSSPTRCAATARAVKPPASYAPDDTLAIRTPPALQHRPLSTSPLRARPPDPAARSPHPGYVLLSSCPSARLHPRPPFVCPHEHKALACFVPTTTTTATLLLVPPAEARKEKTGKRQEETERRPGERERK